MNLRQSIERNYYRKQGLQIRKFLCFYNLDWANKLTFPNEVHPIPKRVTNDDIEKTLDYFSHLNEEIRLQCTAVIHLVSSTGIRASELYHLKEEDINLNNRIMHIHTSKTGNGRIVIFNNQAKESIMEYLEYFHNGCTLTYLFSEKTVERRFKDAPVQVKHLRKFFSQEWDRRGGPTSIKKILMGHSLKGDVDLMHYNAQSPDDLKKIYDRVMDDIQ